ncbi:MAG TPA: 23S rRNA (adenine(2503)-C(2))-methyltransferase RlmN [Nitrospiraceae bacterium]|jgi:23S rRNA (adenine2503-C2)-methyltransferase|nr:23S rRNA (adenine(2503)-C(2))-methyltransferase RlmN [Nitrospiraceae bacterium]
MPAAAQEKVNLLAMSEAELAGFVRELGWPAYRVQQILRWLYRSRAKLVSEMTDLSHADRERLTSICTIEQPSQIRVFSSEDGTRKFVLTLTDKQEVECVLIPDEERLTLCLSTQVGCTLDCGFCLTGRMGLKRNLRIHEIMNQVLLVHDHLGDHTRLTNLVFMGMGEPLANLEAVEEAVVRLTDSRWGLGFSPRRITLSTAGLASRIKDVARMKVNLAVSLNAPTEEVRRAIMPAVEKMYPLKRLMAACRAYPLAQRDRLTFEYVLLAGVNDQPEHARALVRLLRGLRCKVNLIAFNPFPGSAYHRPSDDVIGSFQKLLRRAHFDVYLRRSRGRDVLGACGQLGGMVIPSPAVALTQIQPRC